MKEMSKEHTGALLLPAAMLLQLQAQHVEPRGLLVAVPRVERHSNLLCTIRVHTHV